MSRESSIVGKIRNRSASHWRYFIESKEGRTMKTSSETTEGEIDQGGMDPEKEAAYWREQHPKQPYAKDYS